MRTSAKRPRDFAYLSLDCLRRVIVCESQHTLQTGRTYAAPRRAARAFATGQRLNRPFRCAGVTRTGAARFRSTRWASYSGVYRMDAAQSSRSFKSGTGTKPEEGGRVRAEVLATRIVLAAISSRVAGGFLRSGRDVLQKTRNAHRVCR